MSENHSVKDIVEIGFGTIGKIRILRALAEDNKLLTIYALHKKTSLKREDIKRNISDLISINWVVETKLGNNVYSLNREDYYVKKLITFFQEIGYIGENHYL
ncbi:MAG: hypothetical protein MRJ93_05655 [Nitrososphaeraceae archaeon]|nr:hypothetical protein [Nitrososphaeraceae archaeon]